MTLFANPAFLVALAAVAVPLLVHLLTRDRVRRVAFSTLQFFQRASRRVLRRRKFREALLLALRAAVCALVALAFARPIFKTRDADAAGARTADTARVLLVDVSASMARPGLAEALRREALAALDESAEGRDAVALITFADAPAVQAALADTFADVRTRLAALAPGHGGTDLVEALRRADAELRAARARRKEIVLVSDLQRVGWGTFKGDWRLAADTRLVVRPVRPERDDDLAIIEADVPQSTSLDGVPRTLAVRVANFSPNAVSGVGVTLAVGGKDAETRQVHVREGDSVAVRFRHVFITPGDNPGAVRVAAADAAPQDNVHYFNTRVIPRIRVVVLGGPLPVAGPAGGATRAVDAAYFLEKALAPTSDSPFEVKRVAAASATPADLEGALVAVLADVPEVSSGVAKALEGVLARGGGLLFMPGAHADPAAFGRVFAGLAPCRLKGILRPGSRPGETPGAVLAEVDYEHPALEIFQHPHYGDLSLPRFVQFWEVTDSQLARVLARFDNGSPAIIEREMGGGVSMMMTAPADLRWTNLPLRAVFLPLLHQSVRYLAVGSEKRTAYHVGETLPAPEGAAVTAPDGKPVEAFPVVAAAPGFYAVGGETPFQFAVNLDPSEADPQAIAPEEIVAAVQSPEIAADDAGGAAAVLGGTDDGDDGRLWWYVIVAVVALSIVELAVANRTNRH
jgi:hypothetical protein